MNVMDRESRIENVRAAKFTSGEGKKFILWGDPGLYPGADTMSPKLSLGFSRADRLGSAGILMTREGEQAVRDHFGNVIRIQPTVDFVTTPTWNTSPIIFEGVPGLPSGKTAKSTTIRGVEIVRETLEASGSDATMLLSVRPTGDTRDGSGTLSEEEIKRMLSRQFTWLLDAAGSRPSVLTLETEPTARGARAFAEVAEEFEHPYIVTLRPTDQGRMPDGTQYDRVAGEIAGQYLVGSGFNCQTIGAIETAMDLARAQGAEPLTMIAAPNGADGFNENIGDLTGTEASQIRVNNISGLKRLRENFGTIIFAGCCNSTTDDIVIWQKAIQGGGAPSETSRQLVTQ